MNSWKRELAIFAAGYVAGACLAYALGYNNANKKHEAFQAGFADCAHQVEDKYGGY
jgi:hypothetical protein